MVCYKKNVGGMSEWLKEAVLKTVVPKGTVGSNPTPSARKFDFVKFHDWLVAVRSWQNGFAQHVDATSKNLTANSNLVRDSMKFRFKEFRVYQDAKDYCKFCRDVIANHIGRRDTSLTGQLERALNSIVLNIAEGSADNSDAEFARFLGISIRSVYESVAGFDLATLYEYIDDGLNEKVEDKAHILVKQLASFRNKLRT